MSYGYTEPCDEWGTDHPREVEAQEQALAEEEQATGCTWEQDDDGVWNTACGYLFEVSNDTPAENDMRFCTYCGRPLEQAERMISEDA